mgnify:CR=1 FL=1
MKIKLDGRFYVLLLAIVLASTPAFSKGYKCEVKSGEWFDSEDTSGELVEHPLIEYHQEFVVDRVTGRMIGDLSNTNSFGEPKILHLGNKEYSFRSITIYENGTVALLQVLEYHEGLQKPFLFIDGTNVYSGKCVNY